MQTRGLTNLSRIRVLQVHKVQHKPRKKSVWDTILLEQKGLELLKNGA
jgi:predicted MarR family transcription regulator